MRRWRTEEGSGGQRLEQCVLPAHVGCGEELAHEWRVNELAGPALANGKVESAVAGLDGTTSG